MTKIYDWKNLLNAWEKVEENEGCAGIDGITIDKFDLDLSNNLTSIQNELMNQSYKPDPLLRFYVEKDNAEKRPLSVPTVRDRVAQTAVTLILNPIFEQEFEDISFAYRLNKSRHNAISKITEWRDKGYVWVIDADIKSYFDEVNHDILIKRVRELVSDEYVIQLIVLWITSPIYDKDGVILPPKGLPQGAVISPLLANLYLDRFDEAMEKSRYKLVRYADDFLVLCESKHLAEQALEIVRNILSDLGLMLNKEKTKIVSFDDGFEYLGAIFARSLVTIPEPEYGKVKPPITGISEAKKLYSTTKGTPLGKALIDSFRESNLQAMDCNIEPKETPINTELDVEASSLAFMRTLYIQSQGSILRRQNERFVVSKDEEVISEVHIMKVEQIIIFGNCAITTPAMTTCLQENIPITFLSSNGKYYGRLESTNNTNIVLQQLQFERANDENFCLKISKGFVKGKLNNMRIFLQRRNREITSEAIQKAIDSISADIKNSEDTLAIDQLRGYEGTASARYFDVFDLMLKDTLGFEKRIRQPPTDPINSLLSFGYTLLFYNIYSLLTIHGLNPYCGFFHSIRQGHPALASDMIEEFRSIVIDSLVVYLVNSGILKESDFIYPQDPDKPCLLSNSARKEFIGRFEQKMHTEITHPQTGFHTNYRRCIELQVKELIRCIKWEKEEYVPMIISH
jgi:CRISPR-associated protein Cas1